MTAIVVTEPREPRDLESWRAYVRGHADATVYHLPEWVEIFERGLDYRARLLMARAPDTGAVCGVLPLFHVRSLLANRLVAVPFRDRGGPLWDIPEAFAALVARAKAIAAEERASMLVLKTIAPFPPELVQAAGLTETRHWIRSAVSLRGGGAQSLWERIGDKTRNMIRQAEAHGLRCERIADPASFAHAWHELHLLTQENLGVPPFPARFFRTMLESLSRERALAVIAVRDAAGRAVAATLLLLHGKTAIYGYSASDYRLRRARPNDLLLYRTIEWAVEQGFECLDLGSDSPQQEGLLFFKRKWGASQSPIPTYAHGARPFRVVDSSSSRYAAARWVLRRLPRRMLAAVGAAAIRHFG